MALSAYNIHVFHMHRMAYRSHREYKVRVACISGTAKKLTFYCGGWRGGWGGGYWFRKFLRYKIDGSYGYSCSEYLVVN